MSRLHHGRLEFRVQNDHEWRLGAKDVPYRKIIILRGRGVLDLSVIVKAGVGATYVTVRSWMQHRVIESGVKHSFGRIVARNLNAAKLFVPRVASCRLHPCIIPVSDLCPKIVACLFNRNEGGTDPNRNHIPTTYGTKAQIGTKARTRRGGRLFLGCCRSTTL